MAWCIPNDCLALLSTNFDALGKGSKAKILRSYLVQAEQNMLFTRGWGRPSYGTE